MLNDWALQGEGVQEQGEGGWGMGADVGRKVFACFLY